MYSKLLSILDNEKKSISKHRANIGPISLNVGVRRRAINTINNENEIISKRLNEISCVVPKKEKLEKDFKEEFTKYKRACSTRRVDGEAYLDPLIHKRIQFEIATSQFSNKYGALESQSLYQITPRNKGPKGISMYEIGHDDDSGDIAPMYNMTLKSHRLETAKKQLPFNVDNMSKHSLKNKMAVIDSNLSPRASNKELFKLTVKPNTFSNLLDSAPQMSPLSATVEKLIDRAIPQKTDKWKRNFNSLHSITQQSKSSFPARTAMDINDIKFDYKTLIFDENETMDNQLREKERLEKIKMDPFMREFLSRKGSNGTTEASRITPRSNAFGTRNSSI